MGVSRGRTLTPSTLDEYFELEQPSTHRLGNAPTIDLVLNGPEHKVELLVASDETLAGLQLPKAMRVAGALNSRGERAVRISVGSLDRPFEAYSLLLSVAEAVLDGSPIRLAVSNGVARFKSMLAAEEATVHETVGVFGEVLVVLAVAESVGPEVAVASWIGSDGEEHDFRLPEVDLEVKTTTQESRIHRISSLTQLEPLPGRRLFMASIQLTAGGASGETLRELIARVTLALGEQGAEFSAKATSRWLGAAAETMQFELRSSIRVFEVGDTFPALTPPALLSIHDRALLSDVRYSVNVEPLIGASSLLDDWKDSL